VPPAASGKQDFAGRLRELRVRAGSPSFRRLAKITNYSPSTLADATSGRRLPTEPVVKALVSACGEDPGPWLAELRQIAGAEQRAARRAEAGQQAARGVGDGGSTDSDDLAFGGIPLPAGVVGVAVGRARRRRLATACTSAVVVFGAGLGIGHMATPNAFSTSSSPNVQSLPGVPGFFGTPTAAPAGRVTDGTDPYVGHCTSDARLVDKAPVLRSGAQIGALELWYSPSCAAGWARIYLYPGEPVMLGEATVRSGDVRFTTTTDPLVKQVPVYTDVIVPGHGGCLGAGGSLYEANQPVLTAALPCEAPDSVSPGAKQEPSAAYP
jgi:Helix-turn-helix domain/Protein of unknown function (DUF2690)